MDNKINELINKINHLENELEKEVAKRHDKMGKQFLELGEEMKRMQQKVKVSAVRYVLDANILFIISAPIIYSLIIPFALLDLMVTIYQAICFPIYKIEKVKRKDYLVFDRAKLEYLNIIEKINCAYCAYGNGILAYSREVAARTEKFWCPIKHKERLLGAHKYYRSFSDYGDGEKYRKELLEHRDELKEREEE